MDKYAGVRYDDIGKILHDETIVGEVVKRCTRDIPHCLSVMDVGIGTGDTTVAVFESRPNMLVYGVDNNQERLDIAEAKLQDPSIVLVNTDLNQYLSQQDSESFDLVYSAFTMHSLKIEERAQAYNGIHRVLKPGMFFIDYDITFLEDKGSERVLAWIRRLDNAFDRGELSKDEYLTWIKHKLEESQPEFRTTLEERLEMLRQAGFAENTVELIHPTMDYALVTSIKSD